MTCHLWICTRLKKGCVSDSSLFGVSRLNRLMDEDAADKYQCVLLGDNAYPCLRYVMTPIINCKSLSVCMYVCVCVCVCWETTNTRVSDM